MTDPRPASHAQRLRDYVRHYAGEATLTCEFEPGGKLNGCGIPSALWCRHCGKQRLWHDVAAAVAIVEANELPLFVRH